MSAALRSTLHRPEPRVRAYGPTLVAMPEAPEKTSTWPQVRLNPELNKRCMSLLSRTQNGMSVTKLINGLVTDALDIIENPGDERTEASMISFLRAQIGHAVPPPTEFDETISRLEAITTQINKRLSALEKAGQSSSLSEDPPAPRKPSPKGKGSR